MKKDYIPLWIALGSGFFGLLTTIADNLTKNLVIQIPVERSVQKAVETQQLKSIVKSTSQFDLFTWVLANPKVVVFTTISIVGVVVFLVIKFKKHRINRKKK